MERAANRFAALFFFGTTSARIALVDFGEKRSEFPWLDVDQVLRLRIRAGSNVRGELAEGRDPFLLQAVLFRREISVAIGPGTTSISAPNAPVAS